MIARLLLAGVLLLAVGGTASGRAQHDSGVAAGAPSRFTFSRAAQQDANGFYFQPAGLCEDYPEETTTPEKIANDFDVLRRTGTRLLRFGVGWDGIETAPGRYEWRLLDEIVATAEREGVTLLPYVCYTPDWAGSGGSDSWREPPRDLNRFGSFVYAVASRYRGRVKSWELWNEPDNRDYWRGTPKQFAAMFKSGATAVRRADPEATVVLGGLTQPPRSAFFQAAVTRHGLARWFDVLNFHAYFETWDDTPAEALPRRASAYANALQSAGTQPRQRDVWLAEFGYSSLPPRGGRVSEWVRARYAHEHTREFQAVALLRQHFLALASGELSLTAWFRVRDLQPAVDVIGDENNRHFGLLDAAGAPKPAFDAMRLWNELMSQPVRAISGARQTPPASAAEVHVFERIDGAWIVAAWLRPEVTRVRQSAAVAEDTRSETLKVKLPHARDIHVHVHRPGGNSAEHPPQAENGFLAGVVVNGVDLFVAELRPRASE